MSNDKKSNEIEITDPNELLNLFGIGDKQNKTGEEFQFLGDMIKTFHKLDDPKGWSRTDIERYLILPVTMLSDYANNPLPIYNKYLDDLLLKKKISKEIYEERKVSFPLITYYLDSRYITALVSKERKGRSEGVEVGKGLMEIIKNKMGMKDDTSMQKTINDLKS